MSQAELRRVQEDLAAVRQAMGLHLSFGKGMLAFGILLTAAAGGAAVVSLVAQDDWLQLAPVAAILLLVPVGAYLYSRCIAYPGHEITLQVLLSSCIYAVVWVAACGYTSATFLGDTIGAARTTALYAASIGILLAFSLMLVRGAVRSRERYYCLGLALSTVLAGMLLPVISPHYSYPAAHCLMAAGFLTGVAIQWYQLREAGPTHAAD